MRRTPSGDGEGVRLEVDSRRLDASRLLWLDVLRAVDRPDRLEFAVACGGRGRLAESDEPHRGAYVSLAVDPPGSTGGCAFEGRVDSVSLRADLHLGPHIVIAAFAEYHFLRVAERKMYRQVTDADLAVRVAQELGLLPVAESSPQVYPSVERSGDPLRFLRSRAEAAGYHLAVTEGRLHFGGVLPRGATHRVSRQGSELLSFESSSRGRAPRRGGECVVRGAAGWRPLDSLELSGFGSTVDRPYQLLRCRQRAAPDGWETTGWFVEAGASYTDWLRGVPA